MNAIPIEFNRHVRAISMPHRLEPVSYFMGLTFFCSNLMDEAYVAFELETNSNLSRMCLNDFISFTLNNERMKVRVRESARDWRVDFWREYGNMLSISM